MKKFNWRATSGKVIIGIVVVVAIILIYDAFAVWYGGTRSSISTLIISNAYKMPFAVYMVGLFNGILIGHLVWRMKGNEDTVVLDNEFKEHSDKEQINLPK
jgi:hypothetical protein